MNSRSSNDLNDQDIARAFDAHKVDVPAALDDKILQAARQSSSTPTSTASTGVYRRNSWLMHGFAIAATVMLTIAIAPMLVQAPEATRTLKQAGSESALMAPIAADTETMATAEVVDADMADTALSTAAAPSAIAESRALTEIAEEELTTGGSASADPTVTTVAKLASQNRRLGEQSYDPDKPDTWLQAIKILAREKETDKAVAEFKNFRARYPDYQSDFKLEEFILTLDQQNIETQENTSD